MKTREPTASGISVSPQAPPRERLRRCMMPIARYWRMTILRPRKSLRISDRRSATGAFAPPSPKAVRMLLASPLSFKAHSAPSHAPFFFSGKGLRECLAADLRKSEGVARRPANIADDDRRAHDAAVRCLRPFARMWPVLVASVLATAPAAAQTPIAGAEGWLLADQLPGVEQRTCTARITGPEANTTLIINNVGLPVLILGRADWNHAGGEIRI